ncbi:MAG: hypothetical protein ACRBCL_13620 [Maritimibacter sp.]
MTHFLPRLLRPLPVRRLQPPDPLDHPDVSRMSPRELADLPSPRPAKP